MAKTDIEKVLTIFHGISAGDVDLATQHMDYKRFVQHNPYATDGVDGLVQFISQSPRDQLQLTVVRAFQDGPYVVTQAKGQRSGRNVFFDIFRFEDGLVVEHWAFSAMDAPPNQSGHTQTDGPTEATLSADTEKNKSIVREYYETIHVSGDHSKSLNIFLEIIASATSPASAMESITSDVTWKNSLNTEASTRSSSCSDREISFL